MKTKTNILILFLFLTLATGVSAATFQEIPTDLISSRPQTKWEQCHFNIFCYFRENLGASFTTINSTDKIKDLPTTLNANFALINTGFLDMGTTSVDSITTLSNLATIGTITTGVWNGTTIAVANGGTGSSTLASNMVLIGNGTSAIKSTAEIGSEGQVLAIVSGIPAWNNTTVNQTLDYIWTGFHTFVASSSFIGPVDFGNGLSTTSWNFANTNGNTASSTFIGIDAQGNASNIPYSYLLQVSTTTDPVTVSNASTTLFSVDIPANSLRNFAVVRGTAHVEINWNNGGVGEDSIELGLYYDDSVIAYSSTTPDFLTANNSVNGGIYEGEFDFYMVVDGSTQEGNYSFNGQAQFDTTSLRRSNQITFTSRDATASETMTTQKTLSLEARTGDTDDTFTIRSFYIELIR